MVSVVSSPGCHSPQRKETAIATETTTAKQNADQDKLLNAPLDTERIKTLPDGPAKGAPYIPAYEAINQANRIFGYGGWSYELIGMPAVVREFAGSEKSKTRHLYAATVKIRARGCDATDVGTTATTSDNVQGHDMAIKGAVSDAMKRALRKWGEQFGNSLYDKAYDVTAEATEQQQTAATAEAATGSTYAIEIPEGALALIGRKEIAIDMDWSNYNGALIWCAAFIMQHGGEILSEQEVWEIVATQLDIDVPASPQDFKGIGELNVRDAIHRQALGEPWEGAAKPAETGI